MYYSITLPTGFDVIKKVHDASYKYFEVNLLNKVYSTVEENAADMYTSGYT